MRKTFIIISSLFLLILALCFFLFVWLQRGTTGKVSTSIPLIPRAPSPTPMPFRELTIPGLRERKYESTLGERTLAYDGENYTAYVTSYSSDGLKVNGLLTIPKDGPPDKSGWPAVIFIHGYIPPSQYQTIGPQYSDYVDYIARNGFVVFKIDLRGHADSEGQAGGGYYGADYVIDTLNAYAALESSNFVDPQKIGLWGHSMAGNAVSRAAAVKKNIPAVVIWAGAVYTYLDFREYGINDASYVPPQPSSTTLNRRQRIIQAVGEITADNIFWQQMAPTNFLDEIETAFSLNHAVDDATVNIEYSRNFNSILDKSALTHELNEYSYGGHNISGQAFVEAMENTVEFYKTHLQ